MSEANTDRTDTVLSGCPSPARMEKTDSSSSRQSGSPIHWDFESWIVADSLTRSGRIRPSSWDDSDDDLSPKLDILDSKTSRIYSSESKEVKGSISSEINELKKRFFESLEKEKASSHDRIENLREILDFKQKYDRRKSPARIRRRSRSSSSSSPVTDTNCQNSPEAKEKQFAQEPELDDSDQISPNSSELDSKHYLNNFFSELRSKRISMLDSVTVIDKVGKESISVCDNLKQEMLNELNSLEVNEDGGYFCKTSRKLSQILEVEENRKELEQSSEENIHKTDSGTEEFQKPIEKNLYTPLPTARSKHSGKYANSTGEINLKKKESYKSVSFEDFGNSEKIGIFSRGCLSDRSAQIFGGKLDDEFIHLCAKSAKTQLNFSKQTDIQDSQQPMQFLCFSSALKTNRKFSVEPTPREEHKEKNSSSLECLEIDFNAPTACESPLPEKNTDGLGQNHTNRTKSGKSKGSSNPQSPKFVLSIGGDSERSFGNINTPESPSKSFFERKIPPLECCSPGKNSKSSVRSETNTPRKSRISSYRSEDCSQKKSSKSSGRPEGFCEHPTEKNLQSSSQSLKSSSRSLKEQRPGTSSPQSGRSIRRSRKLEREKNSDTNTEQFLTEHVLENVKIKSPIASSKVSSASYKLESPKITSNSIETQSSDISEAAEFPKEFHRSPEADVEDASEEICQSHSNTPNCKLSERSLSSRRSLKSIKSTPRSIKRQMTPKNSGSNSFRSKDGLEQQETPRVPVLQEFDKLCDTLDSHTPLASSSAKSSCREIDFPSRQPSRRSHQDPEFSGVREITITPKQQESVEERKLSSRKSSSRSMDSCDKMTATSLENISPHTLEKTRSRPTSWSSIESKFTFVPPEVEKIDIEALSGRSTIFEDDEDKEDIHSNHGSKSGTESDRPSNKRLSIINEVSFEDFDTGNISGQDEKNFWRESLPESRLNSRRSTPKRTEGNKIAKANSKDSPKESFRSLNEKPKDVSALHEHTIPEGGTWSQLIETFEGGKNSSFYSEKNFPGFPFRKDENSIRTSMKESLKKSYKENVKSIEDSYKMSKKLLDSKIQTSKSGRKNQQEDYNFNLVCPETLNEKIQKENERSIQSQQNMFFVNVDKTGAFEIGEFGDMTCWNAGKFDTRDFEKPQDHGDGMQTFKSSQILLLKPEKREKESKTQRQLWTELKEDFRHSGQFSNDLFSEMEATADFNRFIPISLKVSKSDNCINLKTTEGSSSYRSVFLRECSKRENTKNKLIDDSKSDRYPLLKQTEHSSFRSVNCSKEEEFDCERTPRLSRSLSDLEYQLKMEKIDETDSSRAQLLENSDFTERNDESVDLSMFLARKGGGETTIKTNNWLNSKNTDKKKVDKRDKKMKSRAKKSSCSPREPYVQYLSSGSRSRSSVASLKMRRSNCFQNFYKRFISVFCITSTSSPATSK